MLIVLTLAINCQWSFFLAFFSKFLACDPGNFGINCDSKCPSLSYGFNCLSKCDCSEHDCHHVYGCTQASGGICLL